MYIRIELHTSKTLYSQELSDLTINSILVNGNETVISSIEQIKNVDRILQNINDKNLFQPYRNLDSAHELNKKMSLAVSNIFGHKCIYVRTEPQEEDRSIVFKSYRLSKAKEFKELKILIKDNELPDNRNKFSEWDYDFFDQIEVHIVIEEFKQVFGDLIPNADDYLFLPLTDRMYQVNTVNEVKKFMNKSTYYQVILTKYDDKADVSDTDLALALLPEFDEIQEQISNDNVKFIDTVDTEKLAEETIDATKAFNNESDMHPIEADSIIKQGMNVLSYMFNFTDQLNTVVVDTYSFETNKQFGVCFWFKTDNVRNQKLFDIVNVNSKQILQVSINRNSYCYVDYSTSMLTKQLIASGTVLTANTKYGLFLNYTYTEVGRYLTLTVIDDKFNIVQENYVSDIEQFDTTSKLNLYGNNTIGNFRVLKTFTKKSEIADVMSDMLPASKNYFVIMNAVPVLDADKFKVN
jgi:hypothetical protein